MTITPTHLLLAGATGLVGSAVLDAAAERDLAITTVGRRATGRVASEVITDFDRIPEVPGADAAICCLGTTLAAAGSREAFRRVDQDAVLCFARAARRAGVPHFLVVTSVGADPAARVFYARVKGETERALAAEGFHRLDIAQPGLLLGPRAEHRPVEALMQRLDPLTRRLLPPALDRYAGIEVSVVAQALLALCSEQVPGTRRHENRALRRFAGVP